MTGEIEWNTAVSQEVTNIFLKLRLLERTNETVKLETMEYNIGIIAISVVFVLWIRMIYRYKVWFERWV